MRPHLVRIFAVCALSALPCAALAQSGAQEKEFGAFYGVAVDSLRGGYLRNATIIVDGTSRSAVTDSLGRYAIDSVVPGEYRLRVRHPLLDTLALVMVTAPRKVAPLERVALIIGTPSPQTVIAAKCSPAEIAIGPAAVFGTVFDAETDDPSAGATVTTAWSALQIASKGVSVVPQKRTAQVNADGMFRMCGLPNDLTAGVIAARGADSTANVKVDLSMGIAIVSLHLPRSGAAIATNAPARSETTTSPTRTNAGSATVRGRVTDVSNKPVDRARVQIDQDSLSAITSADGTFEISGARAGTRTLSARKLGFEPVQTNVDLKPGASSSVNLKLTKFVPILETVEISAVRNQALERNGFTARCHRGDGACITPEQIARRSSERVNDYLRGVSFLRFRRLSNGRDLVMGRPSVVGGTNGCVRYFVDNIPWANTEDSPDEFYHPSEIGAIEVYRPTQTPPQFMAFSRGGELCYVIVLWTQSGLQLRK